MSTDTVLKTIEIQPTKSHSATLIFLHGLGDRAENLVEWIRFLLGRDMHISAHVKIIFPTAPRQPFSMFGGRVLNVWYDANGNAPSITLPEMKTGYVCIDRLMGDLIAREVQLGIPLSRIVVGGFSMGGATAMQIGYRTHRQLAGIFAMSMYLNYDTAIYDRLEEQPPSAGVPAPELLMFHGDEDDMLLYEWGLCTFRELTRLGVRGEFRRVRKLGHEINRGQLLYIESWVKERLPALPSDLTNKL